MTEFFRPSSLEETLEILNRYKEKAVIVNGGSDIVAGINQRKIEPAAIIYIGDLTELRYIRIEGDFVALGGNITYREMAHNPVCQKVTGLMEAISNLGSPGIRAVATPAGNIGTAAPAADCATMLMALQADVILNSVRGDRIIPLKDFYFGRGRTVKESDEVIREIRFPILKPGDGTGYSKAARRKAQDIGKVLVGVRLHLTGDIVSEATISLGALNATIVRADSLEKAVIGMKKEDAYRFVRENFPKEAALRDSHFKDYKKSVTKSIVAKAFFQALTDAEVGRGRYDKS